MNLYLISQSECTGWDVYESAVVVAESEEAARAMHPGEEENWDGSADEYGAWPSKERVSVKLIGVAADDVSGVICASFRAG